MAAVELRVWGVQAGEDRYCDVSEIKHGGDSDFITCVIQSSSDAEITAVKVLSSHQGCIQNLFTLHFILSHRNILFLYMLVLFPYTCPL